MRRFFNAYLIVLYIVLIVVVGGFLVYFFRILPNQKIKTDSDTIYLKLNESVTPRISSSLLKKSGVKISWKSEKPSIISVTDDGVITSISDGSSIVTVTVKVGNKVENKSILVITTNKDILLTYFSIDVDTITLNVHDTYDIPYTLIPSNATNKRIIWSSTDSSIVSIDDGKIKGLKSGKVIINGLSEDGHFEDNIEVVVK